MARYHANTFPFAVKLDEDQISAFNRRMQGLSMEGLISYLNARRATDNDDWLVLMSIEDRDEWIREGGLDTEHEIAVLKPLHWDAKEKHMVCDIVETRQIFQVTNWNKLIRYKNYHELVNSAYNQRIHKLIGENVPYKDAVKRANNFTDNAEPEKLLEMMPKFEGFTKEKKMYN